MEILDILALTSDDMNTGSSLNSIPSEPRIRFSPLTIPSISNSSFITGSDEPPPQPTRGIIIANTSSSEISLLFISTPPCLMLMILLTLLYINMIKLTSNNYKIVTILDKFK